MTSIALVPSSLASLRRNALPARYIRVASLVFALIACGFAVCDLDAQSGQTINVANGDVAGLTSAIQTLNANGGGTIDLASGGTYSVTASTDWWYGPNAFPAISSGITINGNGATITRASGSPKFRFFYVSGGFSNLPGGSLTLANLTLTGGLAQGGSGGGGLEGGGGGAGFGGAIYNQGVLSLSEVTFNSNTAQGGAGGSPIGGQTSGGGGGGMGGDGGTSQGNANLGGAFGGGGGGFKGNGADSTNENGNGGGVGGSFLASEGGGDCAAGGTSAYGGNGGNAGGSNDLAGGGGGGFMLGENGGSDFLQGPQGPSNPARGGAGAQGGGSGGNATTQYGNGECGGSGGAFGGGGAGASNAILSGGGGGGGVGGGGGAGGGAGNGGFGGGGGANGGGMDQGGSGGFAGGNGGFGGGGGGVGGNGATGAGQGGFGGGEGTQQDSLGHNYGGGGAGFGGAIFNHLGTVYAVSSAFTGNSAVGGTGAFYGDGFGGVLFNLNGTVEISTVTYSGNTATKGGVTDEGNFAYNISDNDGNSAVGQTPLASMVMVNTTIGSPGGDFEDNPVNGAATIDLDASGPFAAVTPGWLSFGSLAVGSTSLPQPVTLTNIGNAPLTISQISVSGGAVLAANSCGTTVAPGASCIVDVSLMANSATAVQGLLTFMDDSLAANTQTVTLNGAGVSQAAATQLVFVNGLPATTWAGETAVVDVVEETSSGTQQYSSADSITLTITGPNSYSKTYTANALHGLASFILPAGLPPVPGVYSFTATAAGRSTATDNTTVVVSTVGASAGATSVTVNIATGGALNSVEVLTSGSPNLDFTKGGGGSCSIGTLYSAGQSCTVSVNLTPKGTGLRTGAVVLLDPNGNALGTSYSSAIVAGAQIAFDPGLPQQIPGSFSYPSAVSINGSGDMFVAGLGQYGIGDGTEQIIEATLNSGSYTTSALNGPQSTWGAIIDAAGNLFVTFAPGEENGAVIEYPWNGQSFGAGIYIQSGVSGYWSSPTAITADSAGSLYVIDGLLVVKLPWTGSGYGPSIQIAPGAFGQPAGLAVDSAGNVYVADSYYDTLWMVPWNNLGTTSPTAINENYSQVNNVAVDGNGNLFVADVGNGTVYRQLNLGGGNFAPQTAVMGGLSQPQGLGVDALGNLYLTAANSNQVWKVDYADPPALIFPTSTLPGTKDNTDGPRSATIVNIGNQPLVFAAPASGTNPSYPANFPVDSAKATCNGSALAPQSSCIVSAWFQPTASGANDGGILLTDNSLSSTTGAIQSIPLSGTGKDISKASLNTLSITFQPRAIQTTSPPQTVTLTNSGTAVLQIASIALSGTTSGDFAKTTTCGSSLAVNATCSVAVTFTPQATGSRAAIITFTDNAGGTAGSQQKVNLTGTGLNQAVAPTFNPPVGLYATSQSVTIASTTPGASIYYTTDGTTPTASSRPFSTPVVISKSTELKAIAVAAGYANSLVSSGYYTIRTAAPTFNLATGTYPTPQSVWISSATSGASIYYTTNGTAPTTSSTLYSAPVIVAKNTTLKAMAVAAGYYVSLASSSAYTIQTAAPTFNPPVALYSAPQSVTISSATTGAKIYYTTDGTAPTTSSKLYSAPVAISKSTTLKALALASGNATSPVFGGYYTIRTAAPTFSPSTGTYTAAQSVTIRSTTSGASIHYTTDGTTPTASSTLYSTPVTISKNTTLKAMAIAAGYANSPVSVATYSIQAAAPTFTPPVAIYTTAQSITIRSTTPGASIYYTTDGTTPTTSSARYSTGVAIGKNTELKAIAVASGYAASPVTGGYYTIRAATPVFNPPAGTYSTTQSVTIASSTQSAAIYYTTDGTTPTTSSTLYSAPVAVSENTTLKAMALATGYAQSTSSSATYTIR
ncbi:MAG TPA: chitobiase/beta-hexosaminidase C-terminal domain-containing protein [Terracidiphilus sp.]|jgi:hypothetical protein